MERKITFADGEYYHIYNRGVEKRDIFTNNDDRRRFVRLLYLSNGDMAFKYKLLDSKKLPDIPRGETIVSIGAYCLMTNHFHLLVRQRTAQGVSSFMEKLTTGYSSYFNKKYERVGPLFQGRFKAEHVNTDEYLKYLYAYIHLNPVKLFDPKWKENGIADKAGAKAYLDGYRYSSYLDYTGVSREEKAILNPDEFPGYFADKHEFNDFISDWLAYKEEEENEDETLGEGEESTSLA